MPLISTIIISLSIVDSRLGLIVEVVVFEGSAAQLGAKWECFINVRGWASLQYIHVVLLCFKKLLVAVFELTFVACDFEINPYVALGVKKVGQHRLRPFVKMDCRIAGLSISLASMRHALHLAPCCALYFH